jgi:hypothetical protein
VAASRCDPSSLDRLRIRSSDQPCTAVFAEFTFGRYLGSAFSAELRLQRWL